MLFIFLIGLIGLLSMLIEQYRSRQYQIVNLNYFKQVDANWIIMLYKNNLSFERLDYFLWPAL